MDPLYACARSLLFRLDAEAAHDLTLQWAERVARFDLSLSLLEATFCPEPDPALSGERMGLEFATPIGLAAGLDKNGVALDTWDALGFGFMEVGTVTPAGGQPGNEKPRLERHVEDAAIVNRMGFNNAGAEALGTRLAARRRRRPVGANLGKAKVTPLEDATGDYLSALGCVWAHADYLVVNVSSPNTPGLRDLQAVEMLEPLLLAVQKANVAHGATAGRGPKPLLLKIAPDLADEDIDALCALVVRCDLAGMIATNTTIDASGLAKAPSIAGGISGRPLKARAMSVTRRVYRMLGPDRVLVGVGGIETAQDAYARIRAGASLIQIYTAFVYEGPSLPGILARGLSELLRRDGFASVADAVGADA